MNMNYPVISVHVAVLFILCCANAQQNLALDNPKFASLERPFAGSPPLLVSLATKEELIHMLLTTFQKELEEEPKNETTQLAIPSLHESELDLVNRYLKDYDETSGKVSSNYIVQKTPLRPQHVAWNPLATYHMIRRYATDLKALLESLDTSKDNHLRTYNYILNIMRGFGWPSDEDLRNQMAAILRVQHVYDLNANEVAEGKILDRETNVALRGSDCYAIGKHGLTSNFYALAIEWLEIAVEKLRNESIPLGQIAEKDLAHAIKLHDTAWEKTQGWEPQFYAHKVSEKRHDRVKRRNVQFETYKGGKTTNLNEINFWGLCSGENYQEPEEKKKLFCYYESKISNNAWAIRPIKTEIHSLHPLIVQYYDIIGDKMIERIKHEAEPSLTRSTVVDESRAGGRKLSIARTSMSGWIPDHFRAPFTAVPKRIGAITGMNAKGPTAAEDLQVASYAFGGHYEVHMDALKVTSETLGRGDRIATFMYYLSDVEKGGNTAFPIAGVAAKPAKGSAVYWYNLWSSGEPDERTWHGACPVILGEKWVANKWIRMYDQMNKYQCFPGGRVPNKFEVNGKPLKF